MTEQMHEHFGCLAWGVIIGVILLLLSLIVPLMNRIPKQGHQTKAVSNCRQVILALKQYADLHRSEFPDTVITQNGGDCRSSNAAFRQMIKEEIVADERIFGCPKSPFTPDNNIGTAPDFTEALKPGECHWMMTAGRFPVDSAVLGGGAAWLSQRSNAQAYDRMAEGIWRALSAG